MLLFFVTSCLVTFNFLSALAVHILLWSKECAQKCLVVNTAKRTAQIVRKHSECFPFIVRKLDLRKRNMFLR